MKPNDEANPLVSIIIPAYKAENYIRYALESVKKQTYSNWELIVVEDAWPDLTEGIIYEFSKSVESHRVVYIRHDVNHGLGATRNTAMKYVTGIYIALLDHDDMWEPEHLQKSIFALENTSADFTYSDVILIDENGIECGTLIPTMEELNDFPASLYSRNFIVPSSSVFKRSSLENVGLFVEHRRYHGCEDYACWIKMIRSGSHFLYLNNSSSFYRQHSEQLTYNMAKMRESAINVLKECKDWPIVPKTARSKRLSYLYNDLAKMKWRDSKWESIKLYIQAWFENPKGFSLKR